MHKAIFLDRDGVLNEERGEYSFLPDHILIPKDVPDGLNRLKRAGFKLIVITNQGGIAKGLYSKQEVLKCHDLIQSMVGGILDDLYYSPYHEISTLSLGRKPGSLLLERAIALHGIDPADSWMLGDKKRDADAAQAVGIKSVLIGDHSTSELNTVSNFNEAVELILSAE